jgi:hypothetical protein
MSGRHVHDGGERRPGCQAGGAPDRLEALGEGVGDGVGDGRVVFDEEGSRVIWPAGPEARGERGLRPERLGDRTRPSTARSPRFKARTPSPADFTLFRLISPRVQTGFMTPIFS